MLKWNVIFNKQFIHINTSYSSSPEVGQEINSGKFWMKFNKNYFYLYSKLDKCVQEWMSEWRINFRQSLMIYQYEVSYVFLNLS